MAESGGELLARVAGHCSVTADASWPTLSCLALEDYPSTVHRIIDSRLHPRRFCCSMDCNGDLTIGPQLELGTVAPGIVGPGGGRRARPETIETWPLTHDNPEFILSCLILRPMLELLSTSCPSRTGTWQDWTSLPEQVCYVQSAEQGAKPAAGACHRCMHRSKEVSSKLRIRIDLLRQPCLHRPYVNVDLSMSKSRLQTDCGRPMISFGYTPSTNQARRLHLGYCNILRGELDASHQAPSSLAGAGAAGCPLLGIDYTDMERSVVVVVVVVVPDLHIHRHVRNIWVMCSIKLQHSCPANLTIIQAILETSIPPYVMIMGGDPTGFFFGSALSFLPPQMLVPQLLIRCPDLYPS
jgi:hypothetical protein